MKKLNLKKSNTESNILSKESFKNVIPEPPKYKIESVKRRVRKHVIVQIQTHLLSNDIPIVNYEPSILFSK